MSRIASNLRVMLRRLPGSARYFRPIQILRVYQQLPYLMATSQPRRLTSKERADD
jgi:hypothetical protein